MKKLLSLAALLVTAGSVLSQEIPYNDGKNAWNEDSLGNHRAVITVKQSGKYARVSIPWRRADENPENKRLILQDGKTGNKILNLQTLSISAEKAEIVFEPVSGTGTYYLYYLPYKNEGRANYPKGVYLKPENTASTDWASGTSAVKTANASVSAFQSIDAFNSFYPMEVAATAKETASLIAKAPRKDFLLFTEDRIYPIRMTDKLPYRWTKQQKLQFSGKASKGEQYSFQIGLFAQQDITVNSVSFSALSNGAGQSIPAAQLSCINTNGTDYKASPLTKTVPVSKGQVQALWCLLHIPQATLPGTYKGTVTIQTTSGQPATVPVSITVDNKALSDAGISEPWKQTRLHWLNSTLYQENTVVAPYTPLELSGNRISLLGRSLELAPDGLPKSIQTYFTPEMTGMTQQPNQLLSDPISLRIVDASGDQQLLPPGGFKITKQSPGTIEWTVTAKNAALQYDLNGSIEFDGFMTYTIAITALNDVSLNDINLQIPFTTKASKYMMGLGQKGGARPENFQWKWEVATKNQDGAWIGGVNAGLQYSLRDETYSRPLNTNFYLQKPLHLPSSWGNGNKGGINISNNNGNALVNNYSGSRTMKKGDKLYYNFTLLITPFHTINTDFQWENRFFHRYKPIDTIVASGATVVNIHHANAINPWINYPFIEYKAMKAFIDSAHQKHLKVKIYNTVRELSNKAYETFPLRSLGHEIYSPGKGGGFSWLQEHIGKDYIAAWFVPEIKDAAIVNSGMSRWHNYYVEGMNWLVQNVGIDGIYLDDVAFDRITMKRIKRALTANGHPGIIDLHSANQFNKSDGFNNSGNLYMEHFPYLNRLWFGEYFDYEKNSPDFFLTEVSGIPFGLMGEMLEGGGNPWRGMIYGMTNRYPWTDNSDPRHLWKVWDEFGMKGTEMIGYWSENCPVTTGNAQVLATVYRKKGAALISIASWAPDATSVSLNIDWKKLGIDPAKATITAPAIPNFQEGRSFQKTESIPVAPAKGWLIEVREN
ncbi:glycoside hydrolase domain-containing protein [Flavihumibacter petaseus]|uniref:Glycoside hydrolase 123-like N-terminal domain-containing protein n=1 Tax=Flavihumibacter petaseus NBRC 106054 TaxID=1220578 RepID=A0A0E9MXC2_9BACT|nr:glycoside hydrolase domain-containing protein [Flavihumibacter petaseus]GAO42153.1 hypothetical protein FPE01S_01_11660 [Flavihumibacter petaseus NBRC 106054]